MNQFQQLADKYKTNTAGIMAAMLARNHAMQPPSPVQTQSNQQGQSMPSLNSINSIKDLFSGGSTAAGTSGNMGMGSDAASLANAESLMGTSGTTGGSAAGTSSGGLGAAGIGGIIAAAIAAQHGLTTDNDRTFEGQKTGDAFSGQFGTEPWFAWAGDKMGLDPTAGEKFDAAIKNKDYGKAFGRSFEMSDYWADPGSSWMEMIGSGLGMDETASGWAFNPAGEILGGVSRWF